MDRIDGISFDEQATWASLVFEGWFGYSSPIPALQVTLTVTADRWDLSNRAVVSLPRILLSGTRQSQALDDLTAAIGDARD